MYFLESTTELIVVVDGFTSTHDVYFLILFPKFISGTESSRSIYDMFVVWDYVDIILYFILVIGVGLWVSYMYFTLSYNLYGPDMGFVD